MDKGFIQTYGTLIVACYAVIQLWIVSVLKFIWRQFIKRPNLEIYTKETIEVGYGNFGPSLAIFATLLALNKELFIENISLHLTRRKDRAEYHFYWVSFRPLQYTVIGDPNFSVEIASGFMVSPKQPHRYNIFFADPYRHAEILPALKEIERKWAEKVRSASGSPLQRPDYNLLFNEFVKDGAVLDSYKLLQRKCYWEAGEYMVAVEVKTQHPERCFEAKRNFSLTEEDCNKLEQNAFPVIVEMCKQPGAIYNFAYPTLSEEK